MKNYSKLFRIILTFFVLGFILWFGGVILRSALGYDLFIPGSDFTLKPNYSNEIRMYNVYLYVITALYTGIGYSIAAISSIFLAVFSYKDFKTRGWLFMSFLLFCITIPIQSYLIYLDYQLASAVYVNGLRDFFSPIIQENFIARLTDAKYTTINSISMLAALTCVLYSIWRPLDKTSLLEEKTN